MTPIHPYFKTPDQNQPTNQEKELAPLHPYFSGNYTKEAKAAKEAEQPSIGIIGNALAGAMSTVDWPLDAAKLALTTYGKFALMEHSITKEGKELSPEEASRQIAENPLIKYFPTQELGEKLAEQATGIRFQPKTEGEQFARKAASFTSPWNIVKGGVKQGAKYLAKKAAINVGAGIAGAGAEKTAEAFGVNPHVAGLIGGLTAGVGEVGANFLTREGEALLSKEGEQIKKLASEHKLYEAPYLYKDKSSIIGKGIISKVRKEETERKIGVTSSEAVKKIFEEQNPISKLVKQGKDLDEMGVDLLNEVSIKARQVKKPLSLKPIVQKIDARIKEIESSVPHLSANDEKELQILKDIKKDFVEVIPPPKTPILDQYGKPIGPTKATRKAKKITATTYVDQYRSQRTS
jgi:hypothetical protein